MMEEVFASRTIDSRLALFDIAGVLTLFQRGRNDLANGLSGERFIPLGLVRCTSLVTKLHELRQFRPGKQARAWSELSAGTDRSPQRETLFSCV